MARMRHASLPDREITVPDISVRQYERMGWTVVEPTKRQAAAQRRRRDTEEN